MPWKFEKENWFFSEVKCCFCTKYNKILFKMKNWVYVQNFNISRPTLIFCLISIFSQNRHRIGTTIFHTTSILHSRKFFFISHTETLSSWKKTGFFSRHTRSKMYKNTATIKDMSRNHSGNQICTFFYLDLKINYYALQRYSSNYFLHVFTIHY